MNLLHEWPLVLFTLTVQLAVGLHLALLAVRALPRARSGALVAGVPGSLSGAQDSSGVGAEDPARSGAEGPSRAGAEDPSGVGAEDSARSGGQDSFGVGGLRGRPFLLVGVLMAGALALSLLHLGTPLNALRTLANLDESWLSREILAALVFLALWALDFFWLRRRRGAAAPEPSDPEPSDPEPGSSSGPAPGVSRVLAWATALAGIALIGVMARIYMVPARPLWDHWLTAAGFFLTTLLLGAVVAAAHVARRPRPEIPAQTGASPIGQAASPAGLSPAGAALLALAVTVALAQMAATLAHPLTLEVAAGAQGTPLVALRLLLLLAGAFLLVIPLAASAFPGLSSAGAGRPGPWVVAALLLLGGSELLGRMLFYAAGTAIPF